MKLLETLSNEEKISLLNGNVVGIFNNLILEGDSFYNKKYDLCLGYYFNRSGEKRISSMYEKILEIKNNITEKPEDIIAKLIRNEFIEKWEIVYNALYKEQYSILDSNSYTETKVANNDEQITYNSKVEDNGNEATNMVTKTNNENSNDTYGFNSSSPVGNDLSYGSDTETVIGDKDSNTTHNTRDKTGNDNKNATVNENTTRNGRDVTGAELIQKELNLRNKEIFFNTIYKDIDSIATLQIY